MFNTLGIEAIICTFSKILLKILKIFKLSEFPIDLYRLFHSIITEGKKELDELVCKIRKGYIPGQSCLMRRGLKR